MEKMVLDLLQIAVLLKVGYSLFKWILGSKKKGRKSIASKVWRLFANRIHYKLDNALKKQKESYYPSSINDGKVIPLRRTK